MASFKTLDDLSVAGKRVLVRADLNVPMRDGKVSDATRIARLAPTLTELADKGARVIVLSHFGRPKGKPDAAFSLQPLVPALSAALGGRKVSFAPDCIGPAAKALVDSLENGDIAVLENTRFYAGEEANSPEMARELASLGDIYVNDAFSAAHRAHASTEGVARLLPSAAGRLMQQELQALEKALTAPTRPVMAVVGGAKVSTKLDLLGNLVARVDKLAIGGGMANTFLYAQGVEVGKSLCERDLANTARDILKKAKAANCTILLQTDAVIAETLAAGVETTVVGIDAVPSDRMILDIGPATQLVWESAMAECHTLVWNGPVGAFETAPFDQGTTALAQAAARLTQSGKLLSVAGGGDTVAALAHAGVEEKFSYVSSAGGAFLEWLEGKTLPGVAALQR
ncbi:MAG: phosphoglycerate kinase [Alphaproteobacteria bacterium]|nr:phosphoglycerate kinase [Alphaproteobacteria bacterium]MBU0796779.1 phosphoglycerate kinase [Alphaproteobacteria bacterium]MBU0888695.1 phosphoglycerate kinase [Alphaproteobacteria bacterium]MBU1813571.1 phosphoglycerate kinase [Alphaproteobacteria bacterium]